MEDSVEDVGSDDTKHVSLNGEVYVPQSVRDQSSCTGFTPLEPDEQHLLSGTQEEQGENVVDDDMPKIESSTFNVEDDQQSTIDSFSSLQSIVLARLGLRKKHVSTNQPTASLLADVKNHCDWARRVDAVDQLGNLGDTINENMRSEIVASLQICALADTNWQVRLAIVQTLAKLGGVDAASSLEVVLQQDINADVRAMAAQELRKQGEAVPLTALLAAVHDQDWNVRAAAVQTLGKVKRQEAINYIVVALDDTDSTVRIEALRALAELVGKEAKQRLSLIEWLDHDELVREEARAVLKSFGASTPMDLLARALEESLIEEQGKPLVEIDTSIPVIKGEEQEHSCENHPQQNIDNLTNHLGLVIYTVEHQLSEMKKDSLAQHLNVDNVSSQEHCYVSLSRKEQGKDNTFLKRWCRRPYSPLIELKRLSSLLIGLLLLSNLMINLVMMQPASIKGSQWHGPIDQSKQVVSGQIFSVDVAFFNDGSTAWSGRDGYTLVCITCMQDQGPSNKTAQIVSMGDWGDDVVQPNQEYTFRLMLKAPKLLGVYVVQLRMQCDSTFFGDLSGPIEIHVTN